MATNGGFSGVSKCYVFKSRLQEYAQKMGLSTPEYETKKEGPSHEPSFRSSVTVKGVRYNSLPGFFNRKAAEQSAAEVALLELSNSSEVTPCISQPIHDTGLCKNLLQEYAQKMNYAIPFYHCQKEETSDRGPSFKCTVEIGGMRYIGSSAITKKEAEIKAARVALLAIQTSNSKSDEPVGHPHLTVVPCKKRAVETAVSKETKNTPKAKKARFKKKMKSKSSGKRVGPTQVLNLQSDPSAIEEACHGLATETASNVQDGGQIGGYSEGEQLSTGDFNKSNPGTLAGASIESSKSTTNSAEIGD
ncbi:hypothetical protein K2173_008047 [Erythroxylum novogranatense]|uniref:DRBM domain-containing protein n=1 Tax=Erythroxylum novogranatense TaxID=1862640 RepID=A0AAV8T8V9_9ROSI|nr:hypothetical protein K2173_008047 [Erythroxylum novogranatense]